MANDRVQDDVSDGKLSTNLTCLGDVDHFTVDCILELSKEFAPGRKEATLEKGVHSTHTLQPSVQLVQMGIWSLPRRMAWRKAA